MRTKKKGKSSSSGGNNDNSLSSSTHNNNMDGALLQPFSAAQVAHEQAQDEQLRRYLENPGAVSMYPRFCMTMHQVADGTRSDNTGDGPVYYLFRKRVYVPPSLRPTTIEYYFDEYHKKQVKNKEGSVVDWGQQLCLHKIWPTIDEDITNYRIKHEKGS